MQQLYVGESCFISVDPYKPHVATGVSISPGERYAFSASGRWRDWFRDAGPEGWGGGWFTRFNRLPGWPFFLLCGSVGRDDRAVFPIGPGREWSVPGEIASWLDRQLYLFANDCRWMYWNNKALNGKEGGPMRLVITRLA